MKKVSSLLVIIFIIIVSTVFTGCSGDTDSEFLNDDAIVLVKNLASEDYASSISEHKYSLVMSLLTNEKVITQIWTTLLNNYGNYVTIYDVDGGSESLNYSATVKIAFQKKCINFKVSYNNIGKISGLHYGTNTDSPSDYGAKPEILPEGIAEKDFTFGLKGLELPATLSYPTNNNGTYPVVILVHGSGPNDKDESIGEQAPFKDIAHALAQQGIAVFRYDKRTLVHGDKFADSDTAYEETVEDAVLASEFIKANDDIHQSEVYILGHSLGAMLIPMIASYSDVDGYIMMAGPITPLHELMLYQYEYIYNLDNKMSFNERMSMVKTQNDVEKIRNINESSDMNEKIFGAAIPYWLYLKNYDMIEMAKNITDPLLIMQGEGDYQVPMEEFNTIKASLSYMNNVEFVSFEGLSHLFTQSGDPPSPEDYNQPNHVEQIVIDDIAEFVNK